VSFSGERYVLMTPQLAGINRAELGPQTGNLGEERQVILAAIDFLVTGF
jgi:toxin CcdB